MRLISRFFTRIAERYLPDAFVFVFALTAIAFVLGMLQGYTPFAVATFWGEGFFNILTFTAQATLVMATGFALAHTPWVHKALTSFARIPKNEVQVIILTTLVMMACSWLSWGFGLVAGAIVAREMGIVHRGKIHYPLVVAATYSGFLVWHAGYSGAIPTLIATPDHFLADAMGVIPVVETIFAPSTLLIVLALVIVVPIANVFMRPKAGEERRSIPESASDLELEDTSEAERNPQSTAGRPRAPDAAAVSDRQDMTPAARFETSRIVPLVLGILGVVYMASFLIGGGAINLNIVILTFFTLGLLLTPSARAYSRTFQGGAKAAYGIIMQFPFYGGIMGMMIGTGMAADIAGGLIAFASAETLPFWAFISAGIVNMFVPSGGGQWAVQGPIMIEAAQALGADMGRVAMGVAWGDAWTNMIQPFWTLPLLAIAGLGIRDIMGYTATILIVSGVVIGGGLLVL